MRRLVLLVLMVMFLILLLATGCGRAPYVDPILRDHVDAFYEVWEDYYPYMGERCNVYLGVSTNPECNTPKPKGYITAGCFDADANSVYITPEALERTNEMGVRATVMHELIHFHYDKEKHDDTLDERGCPASLMHSLTSSPKFIGCYGDYEFLDSMLETFILNYAEKYL